MTVLFTNDFLEHQALSSLVMISTYQGDSEALDRGEYLNTAHLTKKWTTSAFVTLGVKHMLV